MKIVKGENNKGITLIALIITIVVLLILAGVSISMLTGQNGILSKVEEAKIMTANAEIMEQLILAQNEILMSREEVTIDKILEVVEDNGYLTGYAISKETKDDLKIIVTVVDNEGNGLEFEIDEETGELQFTEIKESNNENLENPIYLETTAIEDSEGNKVVIPKGFKLSPESGKNITEGIVIEDEKENQFVWIPVGEDLVRTTEEGTTTVSLELGRYISFTQDETPKSNDVVLTNFFTEKEPGEGNGNTVATDITHFMETTIANGGYYIARYETGEKDSDDKVTSKESSTKYANLTQAQAATDAKNMYEADETLQSDLVNSLAWDTAIMYIQKFSTKADAQSYATRVGNEEGLDEYCKINDMSGGNYEWNTETSSDNTFFGPCAFRGGTSNNSNGLTFTRGCTKVGSANEDTGSRVVLTVESDY